MFVKNELCETYAVSVLDNSYEDIPWIKLSSETYDENIGICVCYLPPSESTRLNDQELFYSTLLEQVHSYQNEGASICVEISTQELGMPQSLFKELMTLRHVASLIIHRT